MTHALDRDIDKKVARTRLRPLAAGTISMTQATLFRPQLGIGLAVLTSMNDYTIALRLLSRWWECIR